MELEIVPEPSDEERAAIVAALAEDAREQAAALPSPPQDFLIDGLDSVRP